MTLKYINSICFYIFTISSIIMVCGLDFEGVGSDGKPRKGISLEDKGKSTIIDTQNPDNLLKTFIKTDVKKERENVSSSSSINVKTMEETLESTADIALRNTLDDVCKILKIGDLMTAGSVCRSWNEIAAREISKRGIERALLPHIYSTEIRNIDKRFHVYDVLSAKPYVALLFVASLQNPPARRGILRDLNQRILDVYKRFFPQYLVTIGFHATMMDENLISNSPGNLGFHNGILGLFIPLHKDVQIKVSSCPYLSNQAPRDCANQVINDLGLTSSTEKSTIIIFGDFPGYDTVLVLDFIKAKLARKNYSLWGAITDDPIRVIHPKITDNETRRKVFALKLSGSNLKSYSIVVDCTIGKSQFDAKLLKFRNSISLAQNNVGLVCAPRDEEHLKEIPNQNIYLNHNELMDAVKRVFPNIPFIGAFNDGSYGHIGVNSMSNDNETLVYRPRLSLMIITYDWKNRLIK